MSFSTLPRLSNPDRFQLFALSALALLISVLGELLLAVVLMTLPWGFTAVLKALPSGFTLVAHGSAGQYLFVLIWAAVSGILYVAGIGRNAWMTRARSVAVIAGAISPWVVLGRAQIEGHLWPSFRDTRGPLDRPLMTLPLLICALLVPWLAGYAARAGAQANMASQ